MTPEREAAIKAAKAAAYDVYYDEIARINKEYPQ